MEIEGDGRPGKPAYWDTGRKHFANGTGHDRASPRGRHPGAGSLPISATEERLGLFIDRHHLNPPGDIRQRAEQPGVFSCTPPQIEPTEWASDGIVVLPAPPPPNGNRLANLDPEFSTVADIRNRENRNEQRGRHEINVFQQAASQAAKPA